MCSGCTGCNGAAIETITIKIEWQHKGEGTMTLPIEKVINDLACELAVSGVEIIFINNTYDPAIPDGHSKFLINGHDLEKIVSEASKSPFSQDMLRKGVFQVLLRNL